MIPSRSETPGTWGLKMNKQIQEAGVQAPQVKEEARQGAVVTVGRATTARNILAMHRSAKTATSAAPWVALIETIYATRRAYRPADWREMLTESARQIIAITERTAGRA